MSNKMLLSEIQTYSLTYLAKLPFSAAFSEDNSCSFITDKGLDILAGVVKLQWILCVLLVTSVRGDDATGMMFGDNTDFLPAAFGDFNSDEQTDLFVIHNDKSTLEILLAQDKELPMHRRAGLVCNFGGLQISSVVPGDFNGDALMDVLVTFYDKSVKLTKVQIVWGDMNSLRCKNNSHYIIEMIDQPLAIDYDKNMIIDLFGVDKGGNRCFWIFSNNNTESSLKCTPMNTTHDFNEGMRECHSHAYLDLDNDNLADLYITTKKSFEIWKGKAAPEGGFVPLKIIPLPPEIIEIGQTVFVDMELKGELNHLVPVCYDNVCSNSSILVYSNETWMNLNVNFHEPGTSNLWHFPLGLSQLYTETITLRTGDFDMDGYPDIMTTLTLTGGEFRSYFLKNVPCVMYCLQFSRTFEIQWKDLIPYNNKTVLGVFYDFQQDGVLDIIFVHYYSVNKNIVYSVSAFKNTVNYDANFIKVMVVTGLTNKNHSSNIDGTLRKIGNVYGTNLPGPKIMYATTTQEGEPRNAIATQLPQSAHFSLNLPYTIFGLGRTPNFIENLTVEVYGKQRDWSQLIPNSQMVVIPWPINTPARWKVQLFVTPSKLIFQSVLALTATCVVIALIIAALYWKERKEDHLERLQEAHKFHFDAM